MSLPRFVQPRWLVLLILMSIVAVAGFGFAASNSVPESGAGDGSGVISGYTVTNIDYTLSTTNPAVIAAVSFDLDATTGAGQPEEVEAKLVAAGSTWYDCTFVSGSGPWGFTCDTTATAVTVLAADQLRIVAAE